MSKMTSRAASPKRKESAEGSVGKEEHDGKKTLRMKVFCRVRPAHHKELDGQLAYNIVEIVDPAQTVLRVGSKQYSFDAVFGFQDNNLHVYDHTTKEIVSHVMNGFNGTLMCYGQTGTGKTHTMSYRRPKDSGLLLQAVEDVFSRIRSDPHPLRFQVFFSYVQLYRDNLQDLLHPECPFLTLRREAEVDDGTGALLDAMLTPPLKTFEQFMTFYERGDKNRVVAETKMNKSSSRGHSLLTFYVKQGASSSPSKRRSDDEKNESDNDLDLESSEPMTSSSEILRNEENDITASPNNSVSKTRGKTGKLVFVDLAGYERLNKTMAEGKQKEEAKHINLSLSALANVIHSITFHSPHVPWRNSKLTRVLRNSLSGNSITSIILTLGPSSAHLTETVNTLYFGHNAIQCKTTVHVNFAELDYKREYSALVKVVHELRERNAVLEQRLASCSTSSLDDRSGVNVHHQRNKALSKNSSDDHNAEDNDGFLTKKDEQNQKKGIVDEEGADDLVPTFHRIQELQMELEEALSKCDRLEETVRTQDTQILEGDDFIIEADKEVEEWQLKYENQNRKYEAALKRIQELEFFQHQGLGDGGGHQDPHRASFNNSSTTDLYNNFRSGSPGKDSSTVTAHSKIPAFNPFAINLAIETPQLQHQNVSKYELQLESGGSPTYPTFFSSSSSNKYGEQQKHPVIEGGGANVEVASETSAPSSSRSSSESNEDQDSSEGIGEGGSEHSLAVSSTVYDDDYLERQKVVEEEADDDGGRKRPPRQFISSEEESENHHRQHLSTPEKKNKNEQQESRLSQKKATTLILPSWRALKLKGSSAKEGKQQQKTNIAPTLSREEFFEEWLSVLENVQRRLHNPNAHYEDDEAEGEETTTNDASTVDPFHVLTKIEEDLRKAVIAAAQGEEKNVSPSPKSKVVGNNKNESFSFTNNPIDILHFFEEYFRLMALTSSAVLSCRADARSNVGRRSGIEEDSHHHSTKKREELLGISSASPLGILQQLQFNLFKGIIQPSNSIFLSPNPKLYALASPNPNKLWWNAENTLCQNRNIFDVNFPRVCDVHIVGECIEGGMLYASYNYTGAEEGNSRLRWYALSSDLVTTSTSSNPMAHDGGGNVIGLNIEEKVTLIAENALSYRVTTSEIGGYVLFEVVPHRLDSEVGCAVVARSPALIQSSIPIVENLRIAGNPMLGEVLTASYEFKGGVEGASIVRWYHSLDGQRFSLFHTGGVEAGNTSKKEGIQRKSVRVGAFLVHHYIRVQVSPLRQDGAKGNVVVSKLVYVNVSKEMDKQLKNAVKEGKAMFSGVRLLLADPLKILKLIQLQKQKKRRGRWPTIVVDRIG